MQLLLPIGRVADVKLRL